MTTNIWLNPQPPPAVKTWSERKKELDYAQWSDVRNLANLGHKRVSADGKNEPLITFEDSLRMRRDDLKIKILDHELNLGWVHPPVEGIDFTVGEQEQKLTITPPVASVTEIVQVIQPSESSLEPEVLPSPPPVVGRRRRSPGSQAVAPPPSPVLQTSSEIQMNLPQFGGTPLQPLVTSNNVASQDSVDKVGKMVAEVGNNGEVTLKVVKELAAEVQKLQKQNMFLMAAIHHLYVSDPGVTQQLLNAKTNPPANLNDFMKLMAFYAGIPT